MAWLRCISFVFMPLFVFPFDKSMPRPVCACRVLCEDALSYKTNPVINDPFGLEAVGNFMEVFNTILVIGLVYASTIVRMFYGVTLKLKGKVFVDAAICSGAGHPSILFRHTPLAASRRYIEDRVEHIACVFVALAGMLATGEFGLGHGDFRSNLHPN